MRMRQGLLLLSRLLQPQKIKTRQPPTARHQNPQALPAQARQTLLHTPPTPIQKQHLSILSPQLRLDRLIEVGGAVQGPSV